MPAPEHGLMAVAPATDQGVGDGIDPQGNRQRDTRQVCRQAQYLAVVEKQESVDAVLNDSVREASGGEGKTTLEIHISAVSHVFHLRSSRRCSSDTHRAFIRDPAFIGLGPGPDGFIGTVDDVLDPSNIAGTVTGG